MKYQKVTDWWVYVIKTPDNMYYPGCSAKKYVCLRWQPKQYNGTTLRSYIEQFGWENLEKIVVIDGLTKEEALQWEDRLICMYTKLGCCINKQRSGGKSHTKEYQQEYRHNHIYEHNEGNKKYYQNHKTELKNWRDEHIEDRKQWYKEFSKKIENIIYNRVHNYNRNHTLIETPSEAKQKYLQWGYIPDYIKSDDILKENNDPELN